MPKSRLLATYSSQRRWTPEEARAVLTALAASRLSVSEFAARRGLDPQRLYFWKRRLDAAPHDGTPPAFIEVMPRSEPCIEVVLRCGRILRTPATIDTGILRQLLDAVEDDGTC